MDIPPGFAVPLSRGDSCRITLTLNTCKPHAATATSPFQRGAN